MEGPSPGPFVMHGARDAIAEGLVHIEQQVASIEQAVAENPGLAFDLAKTLVESVCRAVLSERSVEFSELVDYVRTYVDRESGGSQTPWLSRKELFGDLPIAVVP